MRLTQFINRAVSALSCLPSTLSHLVRVAFVQYLDTYEFEDHLKIMCKHSNSFCIDSAYIGVFHRENLAKAKGDGKKESA